MMLNFCYYITQSLSSTGLSSYAGLQIRSSIPFLLSYLILQSYQPIMSTCRQQAVQLQVAPQQSDCLGQTEQARCIHQGMQHGTLLQRQVHQGHTLPMLMLIIIIIISSSFNHCQAFLRRGESYVSLGTYSLCHVTQPQTSIHSNLIQLSTIHTCFDPPTSILTINHPSLSSSCILIIIIILIMYHHHPHHHHYISQSSSSSLYIIVIIIIMHHITMHHHQEGRRTSPRASRTTRRRVSWRPTRML